VPRPKPQTRTRKPELQPIVRAYFLDETSFEKLKQADEERYGIQYHYNQDAWTLMQLEYTYNEPQLKGLWRAYEDEIIVEYAGKHPGMRPSMWWRFTAPKMPEADLAEHGWMDTWFAADLCEPRKRIGGTGDPLYDHARVVPSFNTNFGIPEHWVDEDFVRRVGRGIAVDFDNPPVFESQARYLQRHHLLTKAEQRHLKAHPELLEPQILDFEVTDDHEDEY
jgi:hypothetical protein